MTKMPRKRHKPEEICREAAPGNGALPALVGCFQHAFLRLSSAKTAQAIRAFESLAERLEAITKAQKAKTLRRWWRRIIRHG
jgi:hypothetical protein